MQVAENINVVSVLLTVIGFLIVYVLNGIKGEIRETKKEVQHLGVELRGVTAELDRRVTKIEARCETTCQKDE